MARALLSAPELDALEALVRQHLRVVRRIEALTEQAAQYDLTPAELPELEAEAQRLRTRVKGTLEAWLERLEQDLLKSLSHLQVHSQAMNETIEDALDLADQLEERDLLKSS